MKHSFSRIFISLVSICFLACSEASWRNNFSHPEIDLSKNLNDRKLNFSICKDIVFPGNEYPTRQDIHKVVVFPVEFRKSIAGFIDELMEGLEKKGWRILDSASQIETSDPVADIQKATGRKPDIVLFFILRNTLLDKWEKALKTADFTKLVLVEDIHYQQDVVPTIRALKFADAFFARYPEAFSNVVFPTSPQCFAYYHGASRQFFKAEKYNPIPKLFVSGATRPELYPLRLPVLKSSLKTHGLIAEYQHPGYDLNKDPQKTMLEYGMQISKYTLALAGVGFGPELFASYIIAKHFEIPATGTAMLTDSIAIPMLEKLGFVEGKHYITASPDNIVSVVKTWLSSGRSEQLAEIAKAGQELIKSRHTIEHRVNELDFQATELFLNKSK